MALPAVSLSREEFEQLVLDDPDRPWGWIFDPDHRFLTAWRRRDDGDDDNVEIREGSMSPIALPWVVISLDDVFAF